MLDPITRILRSKAARGLKLIALSLVVLLGSALPLMIYVLLSPTDVFPMSLTWVFSIGALIAHIGFVVGLVILIVDTYFRKK
jgi:hypothetical protein